MPIIASVRPPRYSWEVCYFRSDGGFCADGSKHRYDLINIPEEKWRRFQDGDVSGPFIIRKKDCPKEWVMVTGWINGKAKLGLVLSDMNEADTERWKGIANPEPETHEASFDLGKTWQPAGVKIQ